MRIGFDVSPLVRPHPPGVVRATAGLCEALERRGRIGLVRLAPPSGLPLRRWRRRWLPAEVRARSLVGIHSPVSAFPPGPGRRVHTVHELPWRHGVRENAGLRHRFWATLGAARADRTLVPSEHVARDLSRGLLRRRVVVVPWGVGPPFAPDPPPGEVDEVLLTRLRLPQTPLVLCPGAVRAKKGLERVLAGLARIAGRGERPPHIVVTGPDTPDLRRALGTASRLGLARWVATVGELSDADLAALYRLAALTCVLSHSEGFGFGVLESLACGTPVVVPAGSAQAEVAGEWGFAVDADDPDAVADAIRRACAERETLRYELPARAAQFSWDACAARVEALWEEIA